MTDTPILRVVYQPPGGLFIGAGVEAAYLTATAPTTVGELFALINRLGQLRANTTARYGAPTVVATQTVADPTNELRPLLDDPELAPGGVLLESTFFDALRARATTKDIPQ